MKKIGNNERSAISVTSQLYIDRSIFVEKFLRWKKLIYKSLLRLRIYYSILMKVMSVAYCSIFDGPRKKINGRNWRWILFTIYRMSEKNTHRWQIPSIEDGIECLKKFLENYHLEGWILINKFLRSNVNRW